MSDSDALAVYPIEKRKRLMRQQRLATRLSELISAYRFDRLMSDRLVNYERRLLSLHHANAFISTLGGGYFLCRFVDDAVRMAAIQLRVAAALGDEKQYARVCIHLVYSCIQTGDFDTATELTLRLSRLESILDDDALRGMILAATRVCDNVKGAYERGTLKTLEAPSPPSHVPEGKEEEKVFHHRSDRGGGAVGLHRESNSSSSSVTRALKRHDEHEISENTDKDSRTDEFFRQHIVNAKSKGRVRQISFAAVAGIEYVVYKRESWKKLLK